MIEVGLNLFWLLVVVASVAAWARTRHCLLGRHRRQLSREIFGLAMAMALLWAPISLTDNLHPVILQAEDGGVTKRIAKWCACRQSPLHHAGVPPLAFFQPHRPAFTRNILYLRAGHPSVPLYLALAGNPLSNRAPPSL